jgi:hypothetical protein
MQHDIKEGNITNGLKEQSISPALVVFAYYITKDDLDKVRWYKEPISRRVPPRIVSIPKSLGDHFIL